MAEVRLCKGTRAWTCDPIGNRLSETLDGGPADVYQYEPNPAAGNSPKLDLIQLGAGGMRDYDHDAAGNQTQVVTSAGTTEMRYDSASRLSTIENLTSNARADFLYDGRSFLQDAQASDTGEIFTDRFESGGPACWSVIVGGAMGGACPPRPATNPTYSSDGLLHHLDRGSEAPSRYVFYHGGMPVATLESAGGGAGSFLYLTTDHLGTPVLASADTGLVSWSGGFEPFGRDYAGADGQGVFLRFPGQWMDGAWGSVSDDTYYNVHRWYAHLTGRYRQPDPYLWNAALRDYRYVLGNPIGLIDPLGLYPGDRTADASTALIRDLNTDLKCISNIKSQVRSVGSGRNRYKHCLGNCLITKNCPNGRASALFASLFKEFSDLHKCVFQQSAGSCRSAFQSQDFDDNRRGRNCPQNEPCENRCSPLSDRTEPPPGPFGWLARNGDFRL